MISGIVHARELPGTMPTALPEHGRVAEDV